MEDHLEVVLLLEEATLQVLLALEDIVQVHQIADHVHPVEAHHRQEVEVTQEEVAVSVKYKKGDFEKGLLFKEIVNGFLPII